MNGKQIPIRNLNQMETIEPIGKYRKIGESIGALVDEKNQAYGDGCADYDRGGKINVK